MKALRILEGVAAGLAEAILAPLLIPLALLRDRDLFTRNRWTPARPGPRRQNLRRLLPTADREASFDGRDGTLLFDREARALALGWGEDRSFDRVIRRIEAIWPSSADPRTLLLALPDSPHPLELRFRSEREATEWKEALDPLIP